jgi:hypothetical protein
MNCIGNALDSIGKWKNPIANLNCSADSRSSTYAFLLLVAPLVDITVKRKAKILVGRNRRRQLKRSIKERALQEVAHLSRQSCVNHNGTLANQSRHSQKLKVKSQLREASVTNSLSLLEKKNGCEPTNVYGHMEIYNDFTNIE